MRPATTANQPQRLSYQRVGEVNEERTTGNYLEGVIRMRDNARSAMASADKSDSFNGPRQMNEGNMMP
jgi:hypothetical protein